MIIPGILKKLLFLISIVMCSTYSFAQESQPKKQAINEKFAKNVAHFTVGGIPGTYSIAQFNYERMLREGKKENVQSMWIRVGIGPWFTWGMESLVYECSFNFLTGHQNNHFESGIGLVYSSEYDINPVPAGRLGYRYQKPTGGLVFRTGAGFPEMIYLSLGYCL